MATRKTHSRRRNSNIKVTVARMSQDVREIEVARGSSLRAALLSAGYAENSLEGLLQGLRVNGQEVSLGSKLKAGDFITLAPNVQGGQQ